MVHFYIDTIFIWDFVIFPICARERKRARSEKGEREQEVPSDKNNVTHSVSLCCTSPRYVTLRNGMPTLPTAPQSRKIKKYNNKIEKL